jgi:hypothetical protein
MTNYFAMMEGDHCRIFDEETIRRAAPRYVATLPDWGMGEGIAIYAQTEAALLKHLMTQPSYYTVTMCDLATGKAYTTPIGALHTEAE